MKPLIKTKNELGFVKPYQNNTSLSLYVRVFTPMAGHTSVALEILKKRHLFPLGGDKKQTLKVKLSRQ